LLQDYRSGALGRVSLETPQSRVELLASYQPPPSLGEPYQGDDEDPSSHPDAV
jgi:ribosome biogenesis GTPase A